MVLLTSNKTRWRLARTILQGIIGVLIANLDMIIGFGGFTPEVKAIIVALTMAVLSPIMGVIAADDKEVETNDKG